MKYKTNWNIRLEDCNNNFEVTNKALLTLMENTTERHQASLGYGLKDIINTGATWVIVDWYLEVIKRPSYGCTLEVYTWISKINGINSNKDFEIYSNSELVTRATSKWILLDIKTKTPIEVPDKFKKEILPSIFNELPRLNILDNYSYEKDTLIRKSDIDLNNHVHNLNYIDFVNELIDKEYNNIRIIYRKEIKKDSNIIIKKESINNTINFLLVDKDNNIYSIIEYK